MPESDFPFAGSISTGTLRSQDLIARFMVTIKAMSPAAAAELTPEVDEVLAALTSDGDDAKEQAGELIERLTTVLEGAAPEGYYFGTHEGDGADFGFWEADEPRTYGKTRVTQDVGSPGKWVAQYFDADMGLWFDLGDPKDTREIAETFLRARLAEGRL